MRRPLRRETDNMTTSGSSMNRLKVTSSKSFEAVVEALEAAVGHPDIRALQSELGAAQDFREIEAAIQKALGKSGFMEFARYDLGAILRRERGRTEPKIMRFVIGNPLVMKEMVKHVPDAGSYAPVTLLIDERPDGVHLSYDTMAGFLAAYGNAEALKVARDLDGKIENLLRQIA
jgi:uncharacterized protein (DUF302 family)